VPVFGWDEAKTVLACVDWIAMANRRGEIFCDTVTCVTLLYSPPDR